MLQSQYFPFVSHALRARRYPDDLKYIPVVESEFSLNAVSRVGATGAWQFMPYTAKEIGLEISEIFDERLYFEGATEGALKKLGAEHGICFEDWILTLAAYNAGYGRVTRAVQEQHDTSFFNLVLPEETIQYVYRMIAVKLILENPGRYGFIPSDFFDDAIMLVPYETDISKPILHIAEEFGIPPLECKLLNPQFVAGVVPRGKFIIRVPRRGFPSPYTQRNALFDSLNN